MKKFKSILVILAICVLVFSCFGQSFSVTAEENSNRPTLVDLVRLKKYLAGIPVNNARTVFYPDYNGDNVVNSADLVDLRKMLLDPSYNPISDEEKSKLDSDGYYSQVIKP